MLMDVGEVYFNHSITFSDMNGLYFAVLVLWGVWIACSLGCYGKCRYAELCTFLLIHMCKMFSRYIFRNRIARLQSLYIFTSFRCAKLFVQASCINLLSHQLCIRILLLHILQHLGL